MTHSPKFFLIASYPRSGNTWVRLLLKHHFGIKSLSQYADVRLMGSKSGGRLRDRPEPSDRCAGIKTHSLRDGLPDGYRCIPALVVVRDGRDAIVSAAHYRRELEDYPKPFVETMRELITKPDIDPHEVFNDWSEFHAYYIEEHPYTVTVIRYEELFSNPRVLLYNSLRWILDIDLETINYQDLDPFDKLHAGFPEFFRAGRTGTWRDEMPPDIEEMFWERHGEMMERLGYKR